MSLKEKVFTGIKFTSMAAIWVAILQTLQLIILTQFLSSSEFGLFALVMVVVGFAQTFQDVGISNAIIHKQKINQKQLSTIFWINLLAGVIVFISVFLVSTFIAAFYKEPQLEHLIRLVSFVFLIQPLGQQFVVLWQKELRFEEIAKIEIFTKTVAFSLTIFLAYHEYKVLSLVYGILCGATLHSLFFLNKGLKEYVIDLHFEPREIKDVISFGGFQMAEKTLNYFHGQVDSMLIGRLLGVEALGVYSISKQIVLKPAQIINPIVSKVTFPTMAKIQDDMSALKFTYLKTINYLSSINFPIYAFIIILAPEIVSTFLGNEWSNSVILIQILSIFGVLRSLGNPIGSLLLAKGKANWGFYWNLGMMVYVPLCILISSKWGVVGVSWGWVFVMASLIIPMWYILVKNLCDASFMEYHLSFLKPLVITCIVASIAFKVSLMFSSVLLKFISVGLVGGVLYFLLTLLYNKIFIMDLKLLLKAKGRKV